MQYKVGKPSEIWLIEMLLALISLETQDAVWQCHKNATKKVTLVRKWRINACISTDLYVKRIHIGQTQADHDFAASNIKNYT